MKKIVSFLLAVSAACAVTFSALAADIAIKVDGRTLTFREEPVPVVLNDRTYVPVRRVLETMGAKVSWNKENRTVTVTSADNVTVVVLTIDSPEIEVYTFTSVIHADKNIVVSDVSPIILNDRTMLPIRVIAEALGADVEYDEAGIAEITTRQAKKSLKRELGEEYASNSKPFADAISEQLPKVSLTCENEGIKKGDEVSLYVHVSDLDKLYADASFAGFATTVFYDRENFKYEGYTCLSENGEVSPAISADNEVFYDNAAKIVYIFNPGSSNPPMEDGTVLKVNFKALSDKGGSFSISDGLSEIGYDNEIVLMEEDKAFSLSKTDEVFIDTTEITVK